MRVDGGGAALRHRAARPHRRGDALTSPALDRRIGELLDELRWPAVDAITYPDGRMTLLDVALHDDGCILVRPSGDSTIAAALADDEPSGFDLTATVTHGDVEVAVGPGAFEDDGVVLVRRRGTRDLVWFAFLERSGPYAAVTVHDGVVDAVTTGGTHWRFAIDDPTAIDVVRDGAAVVRRRRPAPGPWTDADEAAWTTANHRAQAAHTLEDLTRLVTADEDPVARGLAATRLRARFPDAPQTLAALGDLSRDRDPELREQAVAELAWLGPRAADPIAALLADEDLEVHCAAAERLAFLGDERSPHAAAGQ